MAERTIWRRAWECNLCAQQISLVLMKGGGRAWKNHLGSAQYSATYQDTAARFAF